MKQFNSNQYIKNQLMTKINIEMIEQCIPLEGTSKFTCALKKANIYLAKRQ